MHLALPLLCTGPSILCFTAAGSGVEVKDQQIQAKCIKTEDHYAQAHTALQQCKDSNNLFNDNLDQLVAHQAY